MIKQMLSYRVGQGKPIEGKEPKRGHRNQRPTHSHTKLEAIIYIQMTWCTPEQALCMLFQSLSHNNFDYVDLEGFVFLVSSFPSDSYIHFF